MAKKSKESKVTKTTDKKTKPAEEQAVVKNDLVELESAPSYTKSKLYRARLVRKRTVRE